MNMPGHDEGMAGTGRGHYAARQSPPDLDAGAPSLRAEDAQRLDRKALGFLVGIVLLLLAALAVLVRTMGKDDEAAAAGREEAVVIPEAPRVAAPPVRGPSAPAVVEPIPVVSLPAPPMPRAAPERPLPMAAPGPGLVERRSSGGESAQPRDAYMQAMLAGLPGAEAPPSSAPAQAATAARPVMRPETLLVRGTYIRCVLETRIVTDVPGYTSCIVTEPVYSINGRRLLLPAGSRLLGRYDGEPRGPRVAVVWDRITTPTGIDIGMDSPGVDGLGGAGHPGRYSAHWGSRIGSALLVSLIGDAFKYAAAEAGPQGTVVGEGGVVVHSPYESATARTLERLAGQALATRRAPTVTIHQGSLLNVYVSRDVDFSAVVMQL
ncbi:TrbI/VirB10 family protein [Luteimonas granuli]|uniref:TrbI/VirB10 family protein n=1 Tax=Luteimonas granuli TaxID=1176533 RepID=A0A518N617_9GAMM|nr:TrbI/VirB10 family protein [Luteimonas granuli]QDW67360.1 TrbI/VirB10 family protein [Luteimonas granuli]